MLPVVVVDGDNDEGKKEAEDEKGRSGRLLNEVTFGSFANEEEGNTIQGAKDDCFFPSPFDLYKYFFCVFFFDTNF